MKFLIVDDNPDDRELIIQELKKDYPDAAYSEVFRRRDFDAALAVGGFDMIFTDYRLNWTDGLWVLSQFKAHHPHLPVIMVTDTGNEEIAVKGMKAGLSDYVLKKYLFQLLLTVKETLEKEKLRKEYEAAQKALREAHAQLERRVAERTAELLEANTELQHEVAERIRTEAELKQKTIEAEEANRTKSYFLSSVSHELKTPLNAILGYAQLLMDGTYGPLHEEQRKPLEGILRNVKDQSKLVSNLLDLTQIESKKMVVDIEEVDLRKLVEDVCVVMQPLFEKKSLSIHWNIEALPMVESDPYKIRQILMNLLSNALKFTQTGGVTVSARSRAQNEGIEIVVKDTGIGIPAEEVPTIFNAFHQVDRKTTREFGGVGLGLAIVKEIVSLLKGSVGVESTVGAGTTFTISLPYR
ncbi:ATP-binding response regulator [Candidatus Manganitrophus noduliformans]|uniref:ATP-binding response regulator n=1 Tax=Candidatus Manganitrophus noduliformans TaxID=2606439 RepID=UPI00143A8515|nr:hybrid sensor histidine kinase/response regulator [Candidatus Manganitrophus noduliformans]